MMGEGFALALPLSLVIRAPWDWELFDAFSTRKAVFVGTCAVADADASTFLRSLQALRDNSDTAATLITPSAVCCIAGGGSSSAVMIAETEPLML